MNKEIKGAIFSNCGKHRFMLWRVWDNNKPSLMFIGLNPSKADDKEDDNTIKRVKLISKNLGYGGVYMLNLFSFISTDPKKLNIQEGNLVTSNEYLKAGSEVSDKIVFAWGNFKVMGRDKQIKEMFPNSYALEINKTGAPKHPLYVKGNIKLIRYE